MNLVYNHQMLKIGCFLACTITAAFSHTITLPETLVAKDAQVTTVTTSGVNFGEGPSVDPSGTLYFSDRTPSRIRKVSSSGTVADIKNPANDANGMVFDAEGRLIVCVKDGLIRIEKDSSTTTLLKADSVTINSTEGPNDLTLTSDGGIFFTSSLWSGSGKVFYRASNGNVKTILNFKSPPLGYPNGLEYVEEKKLLFLCVTQCDSVLKYHVNDDMSVTRLGMVCKVKSPDGLAIDNNGNLWIASGDGGPCIAVYDSTGKSLGKISIDNQESVQNCAFGGPDRKILYIAAKKAIFRVTTLIGGRSTTGVTSSISQEKKNITTHQSNRLNCQTADNATVKVWSIDGKFVTQYLNQTKDGNTLILDNITTRLSSVLPHGQYYVEYYSNGEIQRKLVNLLTSDEMN